MERDREGDGLVVVEEQGCIAGRAAESVTAVDAAIGIHRVAEFAEPFDVAP